MSPILHATVRVSEITLPATVAIPGRSQFVSTRRMWTLTLKDSEGRSGLGLAAPLPGFSAEGADEVESAFETINAAQGPLIGATFDSCEAVAAFIEGAPWPASVTHAVEQALLNLLATQRNTDALILLGGAEGPLPFHARVTDGWSAQLAIARGAAALKVKVGRGPDALHEVAAIRDAVGPQFRIHIDVNGAWSLDEALAHLPQLEALNVALIEEPLMGADLVGMARLAQTTQITIAADESCRTEADLEAILAANAGSAVVLKPMLIGGVLKTASMARRAADAGKEVIITHCLDGPMGQASASLAARLIPAEALRTISHEPHAVGLVRHPIATAAEVTPERIALKCGSEHMNYRVLAARSATFAGWLSDRGVRPGHTVALRGATTLDWAVAFHGISWLGAIPAPLDPEEHPAQQLGTLQALRPRAVVGPAPTGPWINLDWPSLTEVVPLEPPPWRLSEPRVALTTSGTTGTPKPVTLTTEQLICSAMGSRSRLGHEPADRWLCCLPVHHVGGLSIIIRAAFNRITAVLEPHFEADRVADQLAMGHATVISLVPTMLSKVLDALNERPLSEAVRAVLLGGAATPEDLLSRCAAQRVPVARTWGMTEAGSQVATARPGDLSAGLAPLPLTEVTSEGGVLTITGRLVGQSPLTTGDRGWIDDEGRVHVSGRRDRILISGGKNLDAEAIEEALTSSPTIARACVVALPDPHWGQRPAALLVAAEPKSRPTRGALRQHFTEHMDSYAFPNIMCWVTDLPKTALDKTSLRRVTERLERLTETVGDLHRGEALHVDTGMDMLGGGAQLPIVSAEYSEVEGDRRLPKAPHADLNDELLAEAHGPLEVGLGVDERHAPTLAVEDLSEGIIERNQEGFISRMTVLKDAPKEGDPSTIDLKEAHGETMFEGHKDSDGRTR